MGIRIGDKKNRKKRQKDSIFAIGSQYAWWAFGLLYVYISSSMRSVGMSHSSEDLLVCAVLRAFFSLPYPLSGPRHLPSSPHSPGQEPSHRHNCKHLAMCADTGVTEERGPGWRTSISTFHTLHHNMSAWLCLGCFSRLWVSFSLFFFIKCLQTLKLL